MKKLIYLLVLIIPSLSHGQSDGQRLKETFMEEFDPQGFAYYQYNDGIKKQGQMITQGIAERLDNYSQITNTDDLTSLLSDFNNKMQNIDLLEQEINQQKVNLLNNQADQVGSQLASEDYLGVFANIMGTIDATAEMKEQQVQLESTRKELQRQGDAQITEIYKKRAAFAKQKVQEFRELAAYAEEKELENYFLEMAYYAYCSSYSDACAEPEKATEKSIPNKFISRDDQFKEIAKRKLALAESQKNSGIPYYEGLEFFTQAAITFAAKAASENPTAENYIFLAELQSRESSILAYISILIARSIDAEYVEKRNPNLTERLKVRATRSMDGALRSNNIDYLEAFMKAGLDKSIRFDGKSLLVHAISIDNQDAVQLILNHYIEGLNQDEINEKAQKAILLCAAQDSPKTLNRFIELGVNSTFEINDYSPTSIAAKYGSFKTLSVLLGGKSDLQEVDKKYANSPGYILLKANENPAKAIELLKVSSAPETFIIAKKLVSESLQNENFYKTIYQSKKIRLAIHSNTELAELVKKRFIESILLKQNQLPEKTFRMSAIDYLKSGAIELERMVFVDEFIDHRDLYQLLLKHSAEFNYVLVNVPSISYARTISHESLAYFAYLFEDESLFNWLDNKFNFAEVKNRSGKFLIESMGTSPRSGYYSDDFGNRAVSLIENYIIKEYERHKSLGLNTPYQWPGISRIENKNYIGISPITYVNSNGGNIIHEYIDLFLKYKWLISDVDIRELVYSGVTLNSRNMAGQTAFELWLESEDQIKAILTSQYQSKKLAKIEFKKIANSLKPN